MTFKVGFDSSPVQGVLDAAAGCGADAIFIGCRGLNAVAGMLGSVSYGVIRSAEIPVTAVK